MDLSGLACAVGGGGGAVDSGWASSRSEQLVEACLARVAAVDEDVEAWAFLDPEHALAQARAADECQAVGAADRAAARRAGGRQGHHRHRGHADRERLACCTPGGRRRATRRWWRMLRAAGAVDHGQDGDDGVRQPDAGQDAQPAQRRATRRAAPPAARRRRWRPAWCRWRSAARPAARRSGRRPTAASTASSPPTGSSRATGCSSSRARSITSGCSRARIDDLALLLEQLAGHDERDPDTRPRARVPYQAIAAEEPPLPPMFAFVKTSRWDAVDADAREAFAELVDELGDRVEEVELTVPAAETAAWHRDIMDAEMARWTSSGSGGPDGSGCRRRCAARLERGRAGARLRLPERARPGCPSCTRASPSCSSSATTRS